MGKAVCALAIVFHTVTTTTTTTTTTTNNNNNNNNNTDKHNNTMCSTPTNCVGIVIKGVLSESPNIYKQAV